MSNSSVFLTLQQPRKSSPSSPNLSTILQGVPDDVPLRLFFKALNRLKSGSFEALSAVLERPVERNCFHPAPNSKAFAPPINSYWSLLMPLYLLFSSPFTAIFSLFYFHIYYEILCTIYTILDLYIHLTMYADAVTSNITTPNIQKHALAIAKKLAPPSFLLCPPFKKGLHFTPQSPQLTQTRITRYLLQTLLSLNSGLAFLISSRICL